MTDDKEVLDLAERMFVAYNEQGPNPWKTFDGRDVPTWHQLTDQVRAKWVASAEKAITLVVSEKVQSLTKRGEEFSQVVLQKFMLDQTDQLTMLTALHRAVLSHLSTMMLESLGRFLKEMTPEQLIEMSKLAIKEIQVKEEV